MHTQRAEDFPFMATFKEYDFDPRNLPHDLLAAIGLMTTSAAQTEDCVESAIAGCLGVDFEYGKAVTTHMTAPLRDSVLRSVAELKIDDLDALDELDQLLDNVNDANTKRNAVVHHAWCRDPETGAVFTHRETSRTRFESDLLPMSVDQVKSDALFVYEAGMALYSFLMAHKLLPPFPPEDRFRGHKSKAARKKRREAMLKRGGA
jgi:hypothetical protein